MTTTDGWVDDKVMIPDLLKSAPQVRPVLDRYGLRGCGGPNGPVESLGFFAKAHDVPFAQLVQEIKEALKEAETPKNLSSSAELTDAIYRPFFKSGIAVVLTLGAVWGAYLLLQIGFSGSFTAVGIHDVNAHGHAQIFGWVGLFVMGFAYQAFPRFKHASLCYPRLALASLWMMLAGIIARSVGEPLAENHPWLGDVALSAAGLEVIAILLFVHVLFTTWRASGKPLEFYDYYIASALVWFVIQSVFEAVYLAALLGASAAERLPLVATWQGALRDIQIHGFAMLMILGVSQRFFHNFYGFPAPNRRVSAIALVCLNVAVIGEVLGLILMRTLSHAGAALWYGSVLLLAATVIRLVAGWRIFSRPDESDRSLKFLRAAYVWLFVSLAMLVALPIYQFGLVPWLAADSGAAHTGFSHAFYGAIRHAITVGFVSLMIMGVAGKVVPTLNGIDVRSLRPLWLPFLFVNVGCTLRVVGQTLTDFTSAAFPFAAVSGILEVIGLAIWGVHLFLIMSSRARGWISTHTTQTTPRTCLLPDSPIVASNRVGEVLDHYPDLLNTFLAFGFKPLANPLLRRTVARYVTIDRACKQMNVDTVQLLESLNAARSRNGTRLELPLIGMN